MTYQEAHQRCIYHPDDIVQSKLCGCFYCLRIFPLPRSKSWVDDRQTALCPYCGIDSGLGFASGVEVTEDFLSQMQGR